MLVTKDNFYKVLDVLSGSRELAVDTETTGLEWKDRLFSVIISDQYQDYYFDKRVLGDSIKELQSLFVIRDNRWFFKNAKFDMRMLLHEGLYPQGPIEDIGIAARILKNDHMSYSLDSLAKRESMEKLDIAKKYIKEHKLYELRTTRLGESSKEPRYDWIPLEVIEEYASKDARLTFDLQKIYLSRMDPDDLVVYRNECDLIKVCFDMEMGGIRLDTKYTREGYDYEQNELKAKYRHFLQSTGIEYVDSKSVLIPIFQAAGEQIQYTEKGNESLTDDVLESYTSPVAKLVQDIRFSEKRISTYYANYINLADEDGIIRPTMWQEGTRTGRFSYSNPNLQNVPKEEKSVAPYVIRGCFIPSVRNIFVSLDYAQQEYRMMLAYANEAKLIREVMDGKDVHQATADLLGISRTFAKTLNFAILYGAGPEKIGTMLGIQLQEAARLRTKYFLGLPSVERFIWNVISTGRTRGYVKNWYGRKLRADREFCYALPNHLIQGGCADVVKVAMNLIDPLLTGRASRMVLQVHDQLLFDMHPDDLDLIPQIKEIMENVFPPMNGMKLLVDVSWSDKSFAERDMVKGFPNGHQEVQRLEAVF